MRHTTDYEPTDNNPNEPKKNVSPGKTAALGLGKGMKTPLNDNNLSQKPKVNEPIHKGEPMKSIVNVSDSDSKTHIQSQTQNFENLKMVSPTLIVKPQLPSA